MEKFDIAIIGGGPGGYVAAEKAGHAGKKTILFEERDLGGTCLNRGCIPTKALLHAADVYHMSKNSSEIGIVTQNVDVDHTTMHEHKTQIVQTLRDGIAKLMESCGVSVVREHAKITGPNTIVAGVNEYEADYIVIATGSEVFVPQVEGIDGSGIYTSDDMLEGNAPQLSSVIIVGGGVIGVEFACMYAALGTKVTILGSRKKNHILPMMEKDVGNRIGQLLKKQGVDIYAPCQVVSYSGEAGSKVVTFTDKKGETQSVEAQGVLVAVGRKSYTKDLFGEGFNVDMEGSSIKVDEDGRTSVDNIFAIGDVRYKGIQLAHVASAQGENVISLICGDNNRIEENTVPNCVYSFPEIADVGMSETAAKEAGLEVMSGKAISSANGKCLIEGYESGFAKIVALKSTGKIIGAQIIAPRATDMIAELTVAIKNELTVNDLANSIHPHPTVSEMIREAALKMI